MDQETEAELARIGREWQRLERWRIALEAEHARWREELLAEADRQGMGERLRANPGQRQKRPLDQNSPLKGSPTKGSPAR